MEFGKVYTIDSTFENLFSIQEGFIKGNLFQSTYDFYKYDSPLKYSLSNEERILYMLMQFQFVILELGLFLDLHPECEDAIAMLEKTNIEFKKIKDYYERNYTEICKSDTLNSKKYSWSTSSFPWEVKENVDV